MEQYLSLSCFSVHKSSWRILISPAVLLVGGGYIFVEFFFILQGFYLTERYTGDSPRMAWETTVDYFITQFKKYVPCVTVAAVGMFLEHLLIGDVKALNGLEFFLQIASISQIMPQSLLGLGGLLWFLSAAMFAGSICVFLKSVYGKQANMIFFISIVLLYNYFLNTFGTVDVWHEQILSGAVMAGVCRGMAGVMTGCVIRDLFNRMNAVRFNKVQVLFSRLIVVFGAAGVIAAASLKVKTQLIDLKDYGSLIIFCVLLCCASYHSNVLHFAGANYIDALCLPVYAFQATPILFARKINTGLLGYLIALAVDLAASILWVEIMRRTSRRKKVNISRGH